MSFIFERKHFEEDTFPQNIAQGQARCPYCGQDENDSWEITDSEEHHCGHCDKIYWVETEVIRDFTTYKMIPGIEKIISDEE